MDSDKSCRVDENSWIDEGAGVVSEGGSMANGFTGV